MPIHHLNCGSLKARLGGVKAVIYCLLVETNRGLVLIDTGFGTHDYQDPSTRMRAFMWLVGSPQQQAETAAHQLASLGHTPSDVGAIVLTHLHLDHAGGLPDFPGARVHVHQRELEAAVRPRPLVDLAYDPRHWAHGPRWVVHEGPGEPWYGFESIRIRADLEPEIFLIPLPGHTRGHCGVAIQTESGWLLHCGDAASPFHPATDLHGDPNAGRFFGRIPPRLAARFLGDHTRQLRSLVQQHGDQVQVISSHDVYSLARNTGSRR